MSEDYIQVGFHNLHQMKFRVALTPKLISGEEATIHALQQTPFQLIFTVKEYNHLVQESRKRSKSSLLYPIQWHRSLDHNTVLVCNDGSFRTMFKNWMVLPFNKDLILHELRYYSEYL